MRQMSSLPHALSNGDLLQIGGSTFKIHVECDCDDVCKSPSTISTAPKLETPQQPIVNIVSHDKQRKVELHALRKSVQPYYRDNSGLNRAAARREAHKDYPAPPDEIIEEGLNTGKAIMEKFGWTDGKGLGKGEDGIIEPIAANSTKGRKGLGRK